MPRAEDLDIDLLPELPSALGMTTRDESTAGQPCTEVGVLVVLIGYMA